MTIPEESTNYSDVKMNSYTPVTDQKGYICQRKPVGSDIIDRRFLPFSLFTLLTLSLTTVSGNLRGPSVKSTFPLPERCYSFHVVFTTGLKNRPGDTSLRG